MSATYWWVSPSLALDVRTNEAQQPYVKARDYEVSVERANREEAAANYERLRVQELERRAEVNAAALRAANRLLDSLPKDISPMGQKLLREEMAKLSPAAI